jgi:hypothetical protein
MAAFSRSMRLVLFLLALVGGHAGVSVAQNLEINPAPVKYIAIYNNSPVTIYPVLAIGIKSRDNPDLWMQAFFESVFPNKNPYPPFPTTLVYRAYINEDKGIPAGDSVTIQVPFYTQLKDVTADDIGDDNDQFIDWWNGARVYLFDGKTALDAAKITDGSNQDGSTHRPTPIAYLPTADLPICDPTNPICEPIDFVSYRIDPPFGVPFELQEFTFASAMGPPIAPRPATIDLTYVNYNISSLDSVYLPVAVGPLTDSSVPYVGSTEKIVPFRTSLRNFNASGSAWPYYVPVYFADASTHPTYPVVMGAACSLDPFSGTPAYDLPKLPGAFNLFTASYQSPAPTPPVLSSNPPITSAPYPTSCVEGVPANPPALGTLGQGVLNLWSECTPPMDGPGPTCDEIRTVSNFFTTNYVNACGAQPGSIAMIQAVYGWVPITYNGCTGGALAKTPGYADAIATYCTLQYNYLDTTLPAADIFNPYTALIHKELESSAYAFSIDDELSFKHVVDNGIILTIAGANGLVNQEGTPLPTLDTYKNQCHTS